MSTIFKSNEQKGLFLSFVLHAVAVFFYFFYFYHELHSKKSEKCVMMTIENLYEQQVQQKQIQDKTPSPVQQKQQPIEKVVEEPIKPIEPQPIIEEPQPIVKKEEPIQQPIEQPKIKVSEPIKPVQTIQKVIESTTTAQKQIETPKPQFIEKSASITPAKPTTVISKTDFEIIRDKVLKNLVYPNIAKRMNWQGIVHIAIKIDASGKFISAHIHTSSGRIQLDEAAIRAANDLQNQTLPKPTNDTTIILPINFKLS